MSLGGAGRHDRQDRPLTLRRAMALPLIWPIRFYQLFISPMTPPSCRFYPCCSTYAVTALERFGPIRGGWLTLRRLGRCHPWNPGGVDHVPSRGLVDVMADPVDVTAPGSRVHHH